MKLVNTTSGMLRLFVPSIKLQTDLLPEESIEIRVDQLPFLKNIIDSYNLKVVESEETKPVAKSSSVVPTPAPAPKPVPEPAVVVEQISQPDKEVNVDALLRSDKYYSRDDLQVLTKAQLLEILIDRKVEFTGSKEDIINKILELKLLK